MAGTVRRVRAGRAERRRNRSRCGIREGRDVCADWTWNRHGTERPRKRKHTPSAQRAPAPPGSLRCRAHGRGVRCRPSRRARRRRGIHRGWRSAPGRRGGRAAAGGSGRRCRRRVGVRRAPGGRGAGWRAPCGGRGGPGEFGAGVDRAAADAVALALQFRDELRHAVGGMGGGHGAVVGVGIEIAAVGVVRLDQRVVGLRRVVVIVVRLLGAGVDETGEDLEPALVGIPADVARVGDPVVAVVAPGGTGVDVRGADEVRGDAAG